MANSFFRFKQFTIHQDAAAMKVTTDACLFGAWAAREIGQLNFPAKRVLDIGGGTGLLSLMLAQATDALIDTIEIDEAAATQARENANQSPWRERVQVITGDIKQADLPAYTYPVIISNPPFYENEISASNDRKNIAHHGSGLLWSDLLGKIEQLLETKGRFYLLLPYKRMTEASLLLKKYHLYITQKVLVKQSPKHHYFRAMLEGAHRQVAADREITRYITIRDENEGYTPEFTALLKDYYLYL